MTLKTTVVASILALAPAFAVAAGCSKDMHEVMACADGQTYDYETRSCVDIVTG